MGLYNPFVQRDYELFCYLGGIIDPTFKDPGYIRQMTLHCPAHLDYNPSLSYIVKGGKALMHCKAGCSYEEILAACGLTKADTCLYNTNQDHSYMTRYSLAIQRGKSKTLESMNSKDDIEKQIKRSNWALSPISEESCLKIHNRYGFPMDILIFLSEIGILWHYDDFGTPCWCLVDGGKTLYSGQAVRLDGKPFPQGNTKKTLPGSIASCPIGWECATSSIELLMGPLVDINECLFIICEGVTDYLAMWSLISVFKRRSTVIPLAVLGAGISPTQEIVNALKGCNVRLAFDNDSAGEKAEEVWWTALEGKSNLSRMEVERFGKKDVRDIWDMVRLSPNLTIEIFDTVKGELIYA